MAIRKPPQLAADEPHVVRQERTHNKQMVQELLRAAVQKFKDTEVQGVSGPTRFEAAYDAILFAALAVFAAQGYRVTAGAGHHRLALEGLVGTLGGGQLLLDELDALLTIRNTKYTGWQYFPVVAGSLSRHVEALVSAQQAICVPDHAPSG